MNPLPLRVCYRAWHGEPRMLLTDLCLVIGTQVQLCDSADGVDGKGGPIGRGGLQRGGEPLPSRGGRAIARRGRERLTPR